MPDSARSAIDARLRELGLTLPPASPPKGSYLPAVRAGNLVHVAGQVPMHDGELICHGRVGGGVTPARADELCQRCVLAALAAVDELTGLDALVRVVKVVGYIACVDGYHDQASVLDGASELLVALFGAAGRHARTAIGVADLPSGAPVKLELLVEVGG